MPKWPVFWRCFGAKKGAYRSVFCVLAVGGGLKKTADFVGGSGGGSALFSGGNRKRVALYILPSARGTPDRPMLFSCAIIHRWTVCFSGRTNDLFLERAAVFSLFAGC